MTLNLKSAHAYAAFLLVCLFGGESVSIFLAIEGCFLYLKD